MLIFLRILGGGNPRAPPLNETLFSVEKMGAVTYMCVWW